MFSENSNRLTPVNKLWESDENNDLINRNFNRYLKELGEANINENDLLQILQRGKVLDVACGEGNFVNDCLERNIDAYGIDIALGNKSNIERLTSSNKLPSKLKERLAAGDATSLPFKNDSFKAITNQAGAFSYAHSAQEVIKTLQEQIRVLSPGGKIVINPIEITTNSFFPVNFVNAFLDKDKKLTEDKVEEINSAFNEEINKLIDNNQIRVEVREKENDMYLKRGIMYGVVIITKTGKE